jgi:hypothetical protein
MFVGSLALPPPGCGRRCHSDAPLQLVKAGRTRSKRIRLHHHLLRSGDSSASSASRLCGSVITRTKPDILPGSYQYYSNPVRVKVNLGQTMFTMMKESSPAAQWRQQCQQRLLAAWHPHYQDVARHTAWQLSTLFTFSQSQPWSNYEEINAHLLRSGASSASAPPGCVGPQPRGYGQTYALAAFNTVFKPSKSQSQPWSNYVTRNCSPAARWRQQCQQCLLAARNLLTMIRPYKQPDISGSCQHCSCPVTVKCIHGKDHCEGFLTCCAVVQAGQAVPPGCVAPPPPGCGQTWPPAPLAGQCCAHSACSSSRSSRTADEGW